MKSAVLIISDLAIRIVCQIGAITGQRSFKFVTMATQIYEELTYESIGFGNCVVPMFCTTSKELFFHNS